ncbi:PREDICTED: attractin-like protein 1 [Priapulus caudatus]|uniref:Attractin-like protein 1 n=1 Tax=Priapulus caudatus TaxID=37621 RepID=A0ABM1ET48_PRICU|nr:PREDICTED: attractin-like protein 1 [Priapulus caudatus]
MGHTANVVDDRMVVIFGHNPVYGYVNTVQEYFFGCGSWMTLDPPDAAFMRAPRFGHSAVAHNGSVYIFGGFNSVMMNDMLVYSPGDCSLNEDEESCRTARVGVKCVWVGGKCRYLSQVQQLPDSACPKPAANHEAKCMSLQTCPGCLENSYGCAWCAGMCYPAGICANSSITATTEQNKCKVLECSGVQSCSECQLHPGCAWCDDASNTGKGRCMRGGATGTLADADHNEECLAENWHFIGCPACQCNGHSMCTNDSVCIDCAVPTEGKHCDVCQSGYYGTPLNGANCTECECNGHGDLCDRVSGRCFCTTKGIVGHTCNRCDEPNSYDGDPLDGGTCYYLLTIDYQFTFNLSKPEDAHYSAISFQNSPQKPGEDVEFSITCSGEARVNITWKNDLSDGENPIYANACTFYETTFSQHMFNFGENNLTFYVYVYNFTTPFWLKIAISQNNPIDLLQFFAIFFGCFLLLLLIAAAVWRLKQRYDMYRRRQSKQVYNVYQRRQVSGGRVTRGWGCTER